MNDTSPVWEIVGPDVESGPPPMARGAPWTVAAYELLRERGILSLNELVGEVGHLIPPGRAFRELERRREQGSRRINPDRVMPRTRALPMEDHIRAGRRQILYDSLRELSVPRHGQRLIQDNAEDGTVRFRFNPDYQPKSRGRPRP